MIVAFRACAIAAVAISTAPASFAQEPAIRLLPTARESARVRALQHTFDAHPTDDDRARAFSELKATVEDFVTRQLTTAPAISDAALHAQLRRVLGQAVAENEFPVIQVKSASAWGPGAKQRLWAIAYGVWLGSHGPGGTGAVLDVYSWEPGRSRLAAREEGELSGYSLSADWLESGPHQLAVLVYGRLSGSNGLGSWKALVYSCSASGIRAIWRSPMLHGLTAAGRGQLIALRHARPAEGAASTAAAWTYETYVLTDSTAGGPAVTLVSREVRDR
jgi:hypothetical protein